MLRSMSRIDNVERLIPMLKAFFYEGEQYAILFILRVEERTDMAGAIKN